MVSQATKRAWRRVAASLFLLPALAEGGSTLWAQTGSAYSPTPSANRPADPKEEARLLVKQGRIYLQANDMARAQQCAMLAQQKNAKWDYYEDTPEQLLKDISAMSGNGIRPVGAPVPSDQPGTTSAAPALPPVGSQPSKSATPAATSMPSDPHLLVKMGRDALKAGKLDLAKECGVKANASNARWGLFEDSPRKLLDDVAKARADKDRVDSEKLLVEARKALTNKEYDKAAELAHKSERLHGPYSMWDLGDRPSKVLAEVESAKLRNRKTALPPSPVVTKDTPATNVPASKSASPYVQRDDYKVLPSATLTSGQTTTTTTTSPTPVMNPARQKALALIVECRTLQRSGKLAEARDKAIDAQKLNAEYAANEDRPEIALMELNQQGVAEINRRIEEAMKVAGSQPTPASVAQAQGMLALTRQLAVGMGLDTFPVDEKVSWLSRVGSAKPITPVVIQPDTKGSSPIVLQPGTNSAPTQPVANGAEQGRKMLEKARLELRSGNTGAAKALAEAVAAGPYGMQTEAYALLRNIDVEEQNQKILAANRAYDAGLAAVNRGDHQQAFNIFLQIDGSMLTGDKRAIMKEKMQIAQQMASKQSSQIVAMAPTTAPLQATNFPDNPPPMPGVGGPGMARVSDQPGVKSGPMVAQGPGGGNYADQVKALQKVEFQRQRSEGLKVQREAQARFGKGETDAAIQMLNEYLVKLKEAQLDPTDQGMLQRPVEYRLQTFKVLKAQKDAEVSIALHTSQAQQKHREAAEEQANKEKQIADLMKQFNKLYEDGKFEDAEVLAAKAHELEPESDAPTYAQNMAKMAKRMKTAKQLKDGKEQLNLDALNDTDDEGKALTFKNPIDFDAKRWADIQSRRAADGTVNGRLRTQREKEIERKLSTPTTVDFQNTPLSQALKDLGGYHHINIVPALEALREEQISPETRVSLKVDAIPLASVLKLMLPQAKLTYVIINDVLQVTTEKAARGKLVQKVYSVADLVIPIDNYSVPNAANLMKVLDNATAANMNQMKAMTGRSPGNGLTNGQTVGQASLSTMGSQDTNSQTTGTGAPSPMSSTATTTFATNTLHELLMKLVTNTVAPQSWSDVGGAGQIDYFPIGMALVVNQTPDVQEQVAELLEALRRLQDLEVAVEVRIITVAETFFERIGLDFQVNVKGKNSSAVQEQITSGQFAPAGQLNTFFPNGVISGVTPAGTLTHDLNIPITNSSYQMAIPPFGYPNSPGSNGGLSMGLAFLNEIQVFMFMEAAQGDRRTNIMFAPKLTLFNGQTSTIQIQDFQFFVTAVTVTSVNGQIVFSPSNNPFPVGPATLNNPAGVGINLAIQAVVAADRRYVRLNMAPTLSSLGSAVVPLFPVTTIVTPAFDGGFVGQPIPFTQFIQQPNFTFTNIATTVSVPDGGTVLLGGLKSLSEGRNEFGPPVLSKIPYLNRLVKNTGYGREAQSMMIMVTPRIIINREESERQTGFQETTTEGP
jgi:type II secretory pathway component GspD/PulD (secretin)